ncbi:hypothetical protein GOBAR_DD00007 [Gossypium barbadense]|nr:hypothetical protein GOBAR_DD00007 [Gossypium barbadense]
MPFPNRIIVTGKATENKHILGLIASIFGCDVYTKGWSTDMISTGAALRAAHGWSCHTKGNKPISSLFQDKVLQENLLYQSRSACGRPEYGFQVCLTDEEENGNREESRRFKLKSVL